MIGRTNAGGGGGIKSVQTVTDYPATETKNTLYVRSLTPAQPYDAIEMRYNNDVIWEKEHFEPTEGLVYTYREDTDDYMVGDGTTNARNGFPKGGGIETTINIPEYYDDGIHGYKRVTTIGQYALNDLKINKLNAPYILRIDKRGCSNSWLYGYYIKSVNIASCVFFGESALGSSLTKEHGGQLTNFDFSRVEYIGYSAFGGCRIQGIINFGRNLYNLDPQAFDNAEISRAGFSLDANNQHYVRDGYAIYTADKKKIVYIDFYNRNTSKFTIASECVNIEYLLSNVFNYDYVTEIDFNNVKRIVRVGQLANFIKKVHTIRINTELATNVEFSNCQYVKIGSNVNNKLPSCITQSAYLPNLTRFTIESGNTKFAVDNNVNIYSKDYTELYYYYYKNQTISFRETLKTMKQYCMWINNDNLIEITIPESVTLIESGAFGTQNQCESFNILGTDYTIKSAPTSITTFNGSSTIIDLGKCKRSENFLERISKMKPNVVKIVLPQQTAEGYGDVGFNSSCILEFKQDGTTLSYYLFPNREVLSAAPNSNFTAVENGRIIYGRNETELVMVAGQTSPKLKILNLPTTITTIYGGYSGNVGQYQMLIEKLIVNSKLTSLSAATFSYVEKIVRFNTSSEQIPIISRSGYLIKDRYKVHIPYDDTVAWWNTTNISNWRGQFVGYKTYATGDTFPTTIILSNTTYNLTWYSDEALTTEAGATATADSEYYCTLTKQA